MADKEFFELPKFIKAAKGILIVPQLVKGGFIIGAEGGSGVFLARGTDGSWSPPAFYTLGAGSIGLQIGGEVKEVVFVMMSDKAVDAMLSSEFKLGADRSEEHTSELQSLMRISYAVFCLQKKTNVMIS